MESFKQMADQAAKDRTLKALTPTYHAWDKPGQEIVGAFISKSAVQSNLGGADYNQYLFETDQGPVKFSLGKASDNEFADQFAVGIVYLIRFKGKEKIKGGRQVNNFEVYEVGLATEVTPGIESVTSNDKADDKK